MASYPSGLRDRFAKPSFAGSNPADASPVARVVELVDTADLKSVVRMDVPVRVRPRVHNKSPVFERGFYILSNLSLKFWQE